MHQFEYDPSTYILTSSVNICITANKDLATGDLVCGQYVGRSSLYWKLLLPVGARGILHITCMSRSQPSAETGKAMPRHPRKGAYLTCRLIDQLDALAGGAEEDEEDDEQSSDSESGVGSADEGPKIATGDEHVPVGDDEDVPASGPPSKIFFVSTDVSDV